MSSFDFFRWFFFVVIIVRVSLRLARGLIFPYNYNLLVNTLFYYNIISGITGYWEIHILVSSIFKFISTLHIFFRYCTCAFVKGIIRIFNVVYCTKGIWKKCVTYISMSITYDFTVKINYILRSLYICFVLFHITDHPVLLFET